MQLHFPEVKLKIWLLQSEVGNLFFRIKYLFNKPLPFSFFENVSGLLIMFIHNKIIPWMIFFEAG